MRSRKPAGRSRSSIRSSITTRSRSSGICRRARRSVRRRLPLLYNPDEDGPGLERAMAELCRKASQAVAAGYGILILSDRGVDATHAPIPSLLATAGVHHHLVREGTRTKCGLLIETGDAREVHHVALLLGYGAGAVNPYLAFETLARSDSTGVAPQHHAPPGRQQLRQGAQQGHPEGDVEDGHLDAAKLLRRADLRSRRTRSARSSTSTSRHTASRIGGIGLSRDLRGGPAAPRARLRRTSRTARLQPPDRPLRSSSAAANISGGATASFTCSTRRRCSACSTPPAPGNTRVFKDYTRLVDDQSQQRATLRGLFRLKPAGAADPAWRGRARRSDPAAVLHRRDVVRLDQPGSARDARHRDEPDGREVQHR